MNNPPIDFEAVRKAVLAELQRQGVEFAKVTMRENYSFEYQVIIETFSAETVAYWQDRGSNVDGARIARQLESE